MVYQFIKQTPDKHDKIQKTKEKVCNFRFSSVNNCSEFSKTDQKSHFISCERRSLTTVFRNSLQNFDQSHSFRHKDA